MNINDYVDVQEVTKEDATVFYLSVRNPDESQFEIKTMNGKCTLDENEMLGLVKKTLLEFPCVYLDKKRDNVKIKQKFAEDVANKTKRGNANTVYQNAEYYKGPTHFDCPVIVAKFKDKYAVFKHPKFDDYGHVFIEE